MKTFEAEQAAEDYCRRMNRAKNALYVIVDGPEDDQYTVMLDSEAIDNDFAYRWVA